ncbi:MAG: OmpA family protein [Tannerellaceae bacterium]|nr:OmpA family protein [Tannerellaceae bacterium]MCD8264408.1 OmpA family protein [Tannerellaceae bacterium]
MYDVTNHWGRYDSKRIFRFIPWIGLGYAQHFETQDIPRSESPSLNAGILTAFRLGERVDFNIEVQGSLLNEQFNRVQMGKLSDGIVQLTAGLTFKLGKTDFEVIEPMDYALLNDLNNQINQLRAQNAELSKRPVSCPDCPEPAPVVVDKTQLEHVVMFRLNSYKIEKTQEINIHNTAQAVKDSGARLKVVGYADRNTGTAAYNMQLSEKRARAVAKELTDKYGIPSSQITIEWRGSEEQPFSVNDWNRVVIMRADR